MLSPTTILLFLAVALIALVPVWRLRTAGWPARWLAITWVTLTTAAFLAVRFPGPFRFLLPILVLAYLVPFVAGPERLTRVLGGRRPEPGVIIDVTPRLRVDRQADETGAAGSEDREPGDDRSNHRGDGQAAPPDASGSGRPPVRRPNDPQG